MARTRSKCYLFTSVIGTIFGITSFIVFFFIYGNLKAGTWGLISSIFAMISLHLHLLHVRDKIEDYHSTQTLLPLMKLGCFVALIATAFTLWYIFSAIYWPVSLKDLKNNQGITSVWSFQTAKWGLLLYLAAKRYYRVISGEAVQLLYT